MTTSRYEPGHHDFPVGLSVADPIFGEPARAERSKKKADGRLPKVRFSPFSSFCLFYLYFADCAGDVTEHTINFISFIPIGGLLHGATNQTTSVPSGHFQQILSKTKANSEPSLQPGRRFLSRRRPPPGAGGTSPAAWCGGRGSAGQPGPQRGSRRLRGGESIGGRGRTARRPPLPAAAVGSRPVQRVL